MSWKGVQGHGCIGNMEEVQRVSLLVDKWVWNPMDITEVEAQRTSSSADDMDQVVQKEAWLAWLRNVSFTSHIQ